MQYVVAPITEVSSLLSTVYAQRPILPMGSATHFAVIEDGEMGDVENDDYVAALVRFAAGSRAGGAVGTLEASRVAVGPQCALGFEIYGTDGSAIWNFEQMNELRLCQACACVKGASSRSASKLTHERSRAGEFARASAVCTLHAGAGQRAARGEISRDDGHGEICVRPGGSGGAADFREDLETNTLDASATRCNIRAIP